MSIRPLRRALTAPIGIAALLLLMSPGESTSGRPEAQSGTTFAEPENGRRHAALLQLQHEAVALLKEAAAAPADGGARRRLFVEAARRIESLAAEASSPAADRTGAPLSTDLVQELRKAAAALREQALTRAPAAALISFHTTLDRVGAALASSPGDDLAFEGSYSQTKVAEPAYGGHASAMGPPADAVPAVGADSNTPSPVKFDEVPCIAARTFCGGRTKDHILESGGSGLALFDYDSDGWLDVYVVTAFELSDAREKIPHRNALYRNEGGWTFRDVSAGSGVDVAAWGNGVCTGDYDNDGRLDIHVTNFGPNFLFHNNGNGTFTDVAPEAGVALPPSAGPSFSSATSWSTGCTFFDADADGDLDLYVARYVSTSWSELARAQRTLVWRGGPKTMIGPMGLPGEADTFFENVGNGRFVDATDGRGLTDTARSYGFGVLATDYDNDGWVDLYVANDTSPNFLYQNRGDGRFESVGLAAGVALNGEGRAQAGMGVDSGDYDGDGRRDLVVTNFAHDTNTVYRNRDGRQFDDVTSAIGLAGATFVRMGWGTALFDADLDGDLDLFFANGHIYPNVDEYPELQETFRQKNQLFLNQRAHFADVSATAGEGLQVAQSSRGLAVGDLDNDGDLDLVVSNIDNLPTVLRNGQQTGHHWLAVQLEQAGSNRFCIGARITVDAGGTRQTREIRSGGSYLSQNDLRANFGLGSYSEPVDIEVRMPGGRLFRWRRQAPDRVLRLNLTDQAAAEPSVQ